MTHINQRRDTAANWTFHNPVLHLGEVGWESDTRKFKLGDGTTAWNDLLYAVADIDAPVTSVNGETGDVLLDKTDIGLSNVNNTSDASKPVSTATQTALDLKAPLDSPVFTGNPQAPTPTAGDNDQSLATTEFVKLALAALLDVIYPVGVIYMSTSAANPSTLFGGTWVAWGSGRVPVGVDGAQTEFDTVEETGGAKQVTLDTTMIPNHSHGGVTGLQNAAHTHNGLDGRNYMRYAGAGAGVLHTGTSGSNVVASNGANLGTETANHGHAISAEGGGLPHNNLQPYITCYMWKRTA